MESLDKQLAKSADKSVEEALLLVSKEAALKEVEAQLTAAQERAQRAEQEANRWGAAAAACFYLCFVVLG